TSDTGKFISIRIEDNGIGRAAAAQRQEQINKTSMGVNLAIERLQHFSEAASVDIIDLLDEQGQPGGTKVVIHLPYD
ncbi:MAG TPA: hypothetical protein PKK69_05140, partial [Ferruginibacter sp.]|nr:hypothetical protein [Ferruginibacter sp.]